MNIFKKTLLGMMGFMLVASHGLAMQQSPVDINQKDSRGQSLLHDAVASGYAPIVRKLLLFFPEIDVNERDDNGNSLLTLSVVVKSPEIMNLILNHHNFVIDPDELGQCLIRALLGIRNNQEDEDKYKCGSAIETKNLYIKIAEILINHEKTNILYVYKDYLNRTPLMFAIMAKSFPLLQKLLERKEINDEHKKAALLCAKEWNSSVDGYNDDNIHSIIKLLQCVDNSESKF